MGFVQPKTSKRGIRRSYEGCSALSEFREQSLASRNMRNEGRDRSRGQWDHRSMLTALSGHRVKEQGSMVPFHPGG